MSDALVLAKMKGFDVFNALELWRTYPHDKDSAKGQIYGSTMQENANSVRDAPWDVQHGSRHVSGGGRLSHHAV